jgi:hypothetical protein
MPQREQHAAAGGPPSWCLAVADEGAHPQHAAAVLDGLVEGGSQQGIARRLDSTSTGRIRTSFFFFFGLPG